MTLLLLKLLCGTALSAFACNASGGVFAQPGDLATSRVSGGVPRGSQLDRMA